MMRYIDLAVNAGKKRQSPRTGFLHYFPKDESALDMIPVFENFCFALGLFRQKSAESVRIGKEIIERLLGFQTEGGNFPVYLHEYPKCWDFHLGLKIAPVIIHVLREFSHVLNLEYKTKLELALKKMVQPPKSAQWEARYQACLGNSILPPGLVSPQDWFDWIVSDQLLHEHNTYPIPFDRELCAFLGEHMTQEQGEMEPLSIEYVLADKDGLLNKRLLRDHPNQIYAALLYPFTSREETARSFCLQEDFSRLLWKGSSLHSLVFPDAVREGEWFIYELPEGVEVGRDDLFEVLAYVDISPETSLFINDQKGMVFYLGDTVSIRTPHLTVELSFKILRGEGEFCGQISRGNRPGQIGCIGAHQYEAYDWQISLRTLRRKGSCAIGCAIKIS